MYLPQVWRQFCLIQRLKRDRASIKSRKEFDNGFTIFGTEEGKGGEEEGTVSNDRWKIEIGEREFASRVNIIGKSERKF